MIISHRDKTYQAILNKNTPKRKQNRYNGGYFCSRDIVEEIIPRVQTDRSWITINVRKCVDHSIFFVHNYLHPEWYEFLSDYEDVVLVFHHEKIMPELAHLGKQILLPTFINVDYVKQFRTEKTKDTAYVGRSAIRKGLLLPGDIDFIENVPREELLSRMAEYKKVYAIGRTALEAKVLGCEILPFDPVWNDPDYWKVLDVKDAAAILQEELDKIDGYSLLLQGNK